MSLKRYCQLVLKTIFWFALASFLFIKNRIPEKAPPPPMSPDAPSLQPTEPSFQEGAFSFRERAFNPQASLSRRAFLKAFLAFLGFFGLSRYFKRSSPAATSIRASQLAPATQALPDARTVAYTAAKLPSQKTNA